MPFIGVIIALYFSFYISNRYFTDVKSMVFIIFFSISFFTQMYAKANHNSFVIINTQPDRHKCNEFKFSQDIPINPCDLSLVGANSNYVFFYDHRKKDGITLLKDKVVSYRTPIADGDQIRDFMLSIHDEIIQYFSYVDESTSNKKENVDYIGPRD